MESGSLRGFICTTISLYVGRYANIHISAWDFKLILHSSRVGGRGRHSAIVILNVELCKAFNTSQRCQPFPYNQFWSILGAWHNLHFYRTQYFLYGSKKFFYYYYFSYLENSLPFQRQKKISADKIRWHFIIWLKSNLLKYSILGSLSDNG